MGLGFLVKQGNAYYIADYQGVGQNGWNTVTFQADTPQQLASDFTLIAWTGSVKPPATPNFVCSTGRPDPGWVFHGPRLPRIANFRHRRGQLHGND